jgi:acyl-CoA dehydrogenase family protein 9
MTALGMDRIVGSVPEALRDDALVFEKFTLELARMTDIMLRRHGKSIVDKQFALERLANLAIDLFVGLCTLSRVSAMTADGSPNYEQAVSIAHQFSQMAKRRMNRNIRAMLRNEDEHAKSLATYICDQQAFTWDTISG